MKTKMNKYQRNLNRAAALLLLPLGLGLAGCSSLPKDNANVQTMHFENLHGTRFGEVFLVGGNGLTGHLDVNVYNTLYLNGYNESNKDSAPEALCEAFNSKQVKKEFHVLGTKFNGPKCWMLDWIDIPVGTERDFNGLKARWVASGFFTGGKKSMEMPAYQPHNVTRKSKFGYNKGTTVHLMDDTDGNTWIMKGFEVGLKPAMSFKEAEASLATRVKLPPGWKFYSKVLEQDLVLVPETGIAIIMPDNLFNIYDKTGPGYSNYKP
jgi:hypothetical protein